MIEDTSIAEVRLIDANEKMDGVGPQVESLEVALLDIEVRTEVHLFHNIESRLWLWLPLNWYHSLKKFIIIMVITIPTR